MKYYSQIKQDKWVIDYFGEDYKGFFIEIGSNDGIRFSNTFALENLGWKGICVEASSEYVEILEKNRPNSQCLLLAISDYDGMCDFRNQGLFGKIQNSQGTTECMTMKNLLKITSSPFLIDYVSIDVEGSEMEVLKGFPFDEYTMKLLTIEHNAYAYGPKLKDDIFNYLTLKNYVRIGEIANDPIRICSMGQEDWYIHKDFLKNINFSL
jgi:FkbM family methyltransferase